MNYKYHAADTYMHGWSGKGKLNVPLKGHWTSSTSSPFFSKKVGIFIPLEVLA